MQLSWLFSVLALVLATACAPEPMFNLYSDGTNAVASEKAPPPRRARLRVRPVPLDERIVLGSENDELVNALRLCSTGEPMTLSDFPIISGGDDETVALATVEYMDTSSYTTWTSNVIGASSTITFSSEDMFVPSCRRRSSLLLIYADTNDEYVASPGMTLQLNWSDSGAVATGLYSGSTYDHRAMTDYVEGPEMVWHETAPTFGLNSASPSGTTIPGAEDALWFNSSAADGEDLDPLDSFTFEINSTDNAVSGWNTCAQIADPDVFALYNLSMDGTSRALDNDSDWTFYAEDGTECSYAPTELLSYAQIESLGEVIPAGETQVFSLYFDTSFGIGASAADDDQTQVNLTDATWGYNHLGTSYEFGGDLIDDLPVLGNALLL